MAAVVGFAGLAAASLYLREHREATAVEVVEGEENLLLVCLVVGDKYGFHRLIYDFRFMIYDLLLWHESLKSVFLQ